MAASTHPAHPAAPAPFTGQGSPPWGRLSLWDSPEQPGSTSDTEMPSPGPAQTVENPITAPASTAREQAERTEASPAQPLQQSSSSSPQQLLLLLLRGCRAPVPPLLDSDLKPSQQSRAPDRISPPLPAGNSLGLSKGHSLGSQRCWKVP